MYSGKSNSKKDSAMGCLPEFVVVVNFIRASKCRFFWRDCAWDTNGVPLLACKLFDGPLVGLRLTGEKVKTKKISTAMRLAYYPYGTGTKLERSPKINFRLRPVRH
jgi:hypothetical protein